MENGRSPSANRTILPPPPFLGIDELGKWSLYRATMTEFVATFLFLYVLVSTVIGYGHESDLRAFPSGSCSSVGLQGIAWAVGGMIFVLVYCTAGISGGHINPAVTFGLLVGRKVPLIRALFYILAQVGGAICGAGLVKGFQKELFNRYGGATNGVNNGYSLGTALGAEIVGTFILVFTVFSATDEKRRARDSYVPILAPLPIGFSVFVVHLATLPITGTSINPARSLGAAVMFNQEKAWNEQWIFCVGPLMGAAAAAIYYEHILKASVLKTMTSFKRNSITDGA